MRELLRSRGSVQFTVFALGLCTRVLHSGFALGFCIRALHSVFASGLRVLHPGFWKFLFWVLDISIFALG